MDNRYDGGYFWQGDKVRLRPVRSQDWEMWYQEATDTEGIRLTNLGVALPASPEMAPAWTEKYADCRDPDGFIIYSIETLAGELVGGITLHSRDDKNGKFSFGVRIYRPHRQRGYGEEAVRILLRYGFHERRYQKANSACLEISEESIGLHRKLGFKEEGRRRRSVYMDGRYYDDILFGMTREEFDEIEGGPQQATVEEVKDQDTEDHSEQAIEDQAQDVDVETRVPRRPHRAVRRIDLNPGSGFSFSSVMIADDYVITSHHAGYQAEEGVWPGGVEEQTVQCFRNLRRTLEVAGATLDDVVRTTVLLRNAGDFPKMNEVYRRQFTRGYPATTTMMTDFLDWECLVQVDAVAYRPG